MRKLVFLLVAFIVMGGLSATTAMAEGKGSFVIIGVEFRPIQIKVIKALLEKGGITAQTDDIEIYVEESKSLETSGQPEENVTITVTIVTGKSNVFEKKVEFSKEEMFRAVRYVIRHIVGVKKRVERREKKE